MIPYHSIQTCHTSRYDSRVEQNRKRRRLVEVKFFSFQILGIFLSVLPYLPFIPISSLKAKGLSVPYSARGSSAPSMSTQSVHYDGSIIHIVCDLAAMESIWLRVARYSMVQRGDEI